MARNGGEGGYNSPPLSKVPPCWTVHHAVVNMRHANVLACSYRGSNAVVLHPSGVIIIWKYGKSVHLECRVALG